MADNNPLVSVILTTKNESKNIERFLESINNQSYKNFEIILVDNFSTDKTLDIAKKFNIKKTISQGPERSTQRNIAVKESSGKYVIIPDCDMVLTTNVISDCVKLMETNSNVVGIIIPEESIGKGFWAQSRKLEKSFYIGNDFIEAARFFRRDDFLKLGGYDSKLISGEDWDLSQKMKNLGEIARIQSIIYHNDGTIKLTKALKKKFYYGMNINSYTSKSTNKDASNKQLGIFFRYWIFLSKPKKLFKNPITGCSLLLLKTLEFASIAAGVYYSKLLEIKNGRK